MVSRFSEAKDQATLIKAIPLIRDKDIKIVFAGEGQTLDKMELLVTEKGLQDRVLFLGNRDDVPALIYHAMIGVQSSHWEGFGLTAVEFMASGIPVVASSVPGLKEVVENAGCLVQPGDEVAMASALNSLLATPSLREKNIMAGLNKATQYSIESMADKYQEMYESCVH